MNEKRRFDLAEIEKNIQDKLAVMKKKLRGVFFGNDSKSSYKDTLSSPAETSPAEIKSPDNLSSNDSVLSEDSVLARASELKTNEWQQLATSEARKAPFKIGDIVDVVMSEEDQAYSYGYTIERIEFNSVNGGENKYILKREYIRDGEVREGTISVSESRLLNPQQPDDSPRIDPLLSEIALEILKEFRGKKDVYDQFQAKVEKVWNDRGDELRTLGITSAKNLEDHIFYNEY